MSCQVNLEGLPSRVLEDVFTPENVRVRSSGNALSSLTFPKSRLALWDPDPTGDRLALHLCCHRNPHLVLQEKALRLAHRHARQSSTPRLSCFFLGSVTVDADEEGVTVTLDRFDPGRQQPGASGKVPSALVPGDVAVPIVFIAQKEAEPDAVVHSAADLHASFKVLQQFVSSRQPADVSQLLKVRGRVLWWQQCDSVCFRLAWSLVAPAVGLEVEAVRSLPIIPTALLRSLTGLSGRAQPLSVSRQRGFLSMDQSRKLLLLLESDPKACSLPLVGVWLSGVTHVYSPQVWAWCLRFLFSSALQDRVLSESGCFLLVLFGLTQRAAQFFQCRSPGRGGARPPLCYQLLSGCQSASLYQQVAVSDGRCVQCELSSEESGRQTQIFREALSSFSSAPPPAVGVSISDQDSGVEDEDLSPRPSPNPHPHPPAQQARRVQPSVPELSLLIDSSFIGSTRIGWQETSSAHRPPPSPTPPHLLPVAAGSSPSPSANRKSAPPSGQASSSSSAPPPHPRHLSHLHSTPNSHQEQPCACCPPHTYDCTSIFCSPGLHSAPPPLPVHPPPSHPPPPPSSHLTSPPPVHPASPPSSLPAPPPVHPAPPPSSQMDNDSTSPVPGSCHLLHPSHHSPACHPADELGASCRRRCCEAVLPADAYQLLLQQDRQLRLLQEQVRMLLEAQGKPADADRRTASVAVGTGASLFWGAPAQDVPPQEPQQDVPPSPHSFICTPSFSRPPPSSISPPSSSKPPPSSTNPPSSCPSPTSARSLPPFSKPPPSSCSSPSSPSASSSHGSLPLRPVGGAVDDDIRGQQGPCSPFGPLSGLQSPVLGESASMIDQPDDQQRFYQDLLGQLTSRLQASENEEQQGAEESRSVTEPPEAPHSSCGRRRSCGDSVLDATLRRLQQLGVDVNAERSLLDRDTHNAVENASTLARIDPAAVLPRLRPAEPPVSCSFSGVDLSLEANAIALRYLSDSQLRRLSAGGRPSSEAVLSPCNMSVATRRYMRRYGLIEEEEEDEEEEQRVVAPDPGQQEAAARQPLSEGVNVKLLPQSQLIQDLRPKMQFLAGGDKENHGERRAHSGGASSRQPEGSLGNFLDLSRLRQLPKLF